MSHITERLEEFSYDEMRAIATRLGLRQRGQERKAEWVAAVAHFWQTPASRDRQFAALSPTAGVALYALAEAGQWPWALFQADYGPVRRPGRQKAGTPPPWVAPQSVSEELYYIGLLHPMGGQPIRKATQVCTFDFVATTLGPVVQQRAAETQVDASAWPLLHDVAQYLIYRHQQADLRPLHGRWLSKRHMAALNRRLLSPEPEPLPRSHKATVRFSLLAFLAEAAGLAGRDGVTALGWLWLADTPPTALMRLWRGWQRSAPSLRDRYDLPDAGLNSPWPRALLHLLAGLTVPFAATDLAGHLLGNTTSPWRYYAAEIPDHTRLIHALAYLLAEPLRALGAVAPAHQVADRAASPPDLSPEQQPWALTPTGRWLLHPLLPAPHIRPAPSADPTGTWLDTDAGTAPPVPVPPVPAPQRPGLLVRIPAPQPFVQSAALAAFSDHIDFRAAPAATHTYWLHRETVARAAADGHPFAALQAALADLAVAPGPVALATLHRWHQQGQALRLTHLPLLRSEQPEQMAALWQDRRLRPLLGELLSPTTATLMASLDEAADLLRGAGHFVPRPATVYPLPSHDADDADDADETEPEGARFSSAEGAVLWLAGQLYGQLGEHLALPSPFPTGTMERLWQALDPVEQAQVQSQFDRLHASLTALLDGYALTPPIPDPLATDPEAWRARIGAAIDATQSLRMRYYSAGRNLMTERTVDPYWIEERHGYEYLRAYCHSSGQVLVFRLDRIQEMEAVGG